MEDIFDLSQLSELSELQQSTKHFEELLLLEHEYFLQVCGSCSNFLPFISESGFCKISECNCICKNPKAMIDMWDNKCNNWENSNLIKDI